MQIEHTVKSWAEFITQEEIFFDFPSYMFRGQSDSKWRLEPSISRYLPKGVNEKDALQVEKAAQRDFESKAHTFLPPNTFIAMKDMDIISKWMIMQHHGAPTRLLDWTKSIYVAAYFAVTENLDKEGRIWLLHGEGLLQKMGETFGNIPKPEGKKEVDHEFLKPGTKPVIYDLYDHDHKTPRMAIQQSCFTGCLSILGDHEEILNKTVGGEEETIFFGEIRIPAKLKPEFIKKLYLMNISASSLFPGIDGLGRSIKERLMMYKR